MKYLTAIAFAVLWVFLAEAQVPRTIAYQGILTDSSGSAKPDGIYSMTFRIYDAPSAGSALWTESKNVQIRGGLFWTSLGDSTPFPDPLKFGIPYWLSLQIGGDPELTPRMQLSSAPYSMRSAYADTARFALPQDDTTQVGLGLTITSLSTDPFSTAIFGRSLAATGLVFGVWGGVKSTSDYSRGVTGYASATSGKTFGVVGTTNSATDDAAGVSGDAAQSSGLTYGVFGSTNSNNVGAAGVKGVAYGTYAFGVYGTNGGNGTGVYGEGTSGAVGVTAISQHADAVYARTYDASFYAVNASGAVNATGGYYSISDERYKKNITPLSDGLSLVKRLQPVRFDWRTDADKGMQFPEHRDVGLLAQQVKEVLPEIVRLDGKGFYSVNYQGLIPVLVEAIKELERTVAQQQQVIEGLRTSIDQPVK